MSGDYWMRITAPTEDTVRLDWAPMPEIVGWKLYDTGAVVYLGRPLTRRDLRGRQHRRTRRRLRRTGFRQAWA